MPGKRDDTSDAVRSHLALIATARAQAEHFQRSSSSGGSIAGSLDDVLRRPALRRYRLIREIHRGGQGVVYLAEQSVPQRQVALKMVREGPLASPGIQLRFQREIELLGSLSHPNIVTIHDSGGEGGLLYFVMDFVDGPTLDDHVRPLREQAAASRSRKTVQRFHQETLLLFAKICDAVQAAHLRGIIHRDLKPSNIRIDSRGEPRVLDFGLAKDASSDQRTGEGPSLTEAGQFLGTLAFASPEQAEGANIDLDLRTDVYSLGVILYRLLTGRAPYDAGESVRTLIDAILHQDPIRPAAIVPELNDDMEIILLTALQKQRDRRYQTAGALAADIRHCLAGEPIDAKRDSTWYVVRKRLMHHRLPVAAAIVILALISVGSIVSFALWRASVRQSERAQLEAKKATAISNFLHEMLASASPYRKPGEPTQVQEILHSAQLRLDAGAFRLQPEVEAGLRNTLGTSYLALGRTNSAIQVLTSALNTRKRALSPNDPELAISHLNLGHAYFDDGNYADAEEQLRSAHTILAAVGAPREVATSLAEVEYWLGRIEQNRGRTGEARRWIEQSIERLGESGETRLRAACVEALSVVEGQLGHPEQCLSLARQAVSIQREAPGKHPELIGSLTHLGNALVNNHDYREAATVYAEATALSRQLLGRHPVLGDCLAFEAINLIRLGDYEAALESSNECIPILREFLGADHIRTISMLSISANALRKLGRIEESAGVQLECTEINRRLNRRLNLAAGLVSYAQSLQQLGQFEDAEASLRESVGIFREIEIGGKPMPALPVALTNLGSVLLEEERPSDAESVVMEALELIGQSSHNTGTEIASTKMILARCLMARQAWDDAERVLLEGIQDIDRVPSPPAQSAAYHRRLRQLLASLYRAWNEVSPGAGHQAELAKVQEQLRVLESTSNPTDPD